MNAPRLAASPKHPPHSIEAEQSVLGGLLLNNRAWHDVFERVDEDDFYTQDHRLIFAGIAKLLNTATPCDFVTLSEHFRHEGTLDDVGGVSYLGTLCADTPSAANINAYADIVRNRAMLRRLIAAGQDIAELGFTPEGRETALLIAEAERGLLAIRTGAERSSGGMQAMSDLAEKADIAIDRAAKSDGTIALPFGIADLDRMTQGMQAGQLIIVGGRPAMGKSALAQQFAESVSDARAVQSAMFSMEMSGESIALRSYARRARVDLSSLISGSLSDGDWKRLASVGQAIRECQMHVEDAGSLSHLDVASRARRHKIKHGLSVLIVDHLNLMTIPGYKGGRTNEVSEISRGLKALAMELQIVVIGLTQLSRAVEQRQDKRPLLSDLRESGSIEQDADVVLFVYRDDYYNKNSEQPGQAEIIVAKQRNGPTGKVRTMFHGKYMAFDAMAPMNVDPEHYADHEPWDGI
ncbi:replicative DNA helicase [Nevskia sp.]|uniref:replicative DNA helicase n=1 Tax=Nevskia sp. TaxID=1929292 RepID=UPI0025DC61A2|nr:replicative DNA helicase [Nevskia sp.]